ncbi:hypothetical protein AAKU61_004565 [Undibacterium sp. GrIS 1.2]|uniref:hypothetical protein n=1 Tax=Undibacterium sp. GrIS 1.2 TaxID=3143933 RepID=UPI003396B3AE
MIAEDRGVRIFCNRSFRRKLQYFGMSNNDLSEYSLPAVLIDVLLAEYKKTEDSIGEDGLLKQLTKALVERALQAEMSHHIGHGKNQLVVATNRKLRRSTQMQRTAGFTPK